MIKRYCDICKKQIEGDYRTINIESPFRDYANLSPGEEKSKTLMTPKDLCMHCAEKLISQVAFADIRNIKIIKTKTYDIYDRNTGKWLFSRTSLENVLSELSEMPSVRIEFVDRPK